MNIQQYIHSLTDEEFEQLCTEYLTLHYKNKNITIHGTRLKKDGGKDIVGTAQDVPYEIWAECKRHNRALGLEKISKNVILVISKGINELIYFSTSDITRNAVKHVSIVAAKHNFSVTFIYGNRLYQELSILPRFQYGFEKSNEIIKNDLRISRFFSVFEDTEKYTEESYSEEIKKIIATVESYAEKYQTEVPVIVAGGICDKEDVQKVAALGVDGVQVATRFITTEECDADIRYKEAHLNARKEDIAIVKSPVGMPGRALCNPFMKLVENGRIPVKKCYNCLEKCNPGQVPYCITKALIDAVEGDVENGLMFCGANVGRIDKITSVHELMRELAEG